MTCQTHILVVEDRQDWRDIICSAVSEQGYRPHPASGYAEAEALLQQQPFALAIIDPVLDIANRFNRDGLSVVQKIKQIQPEVPVIIVTGSLSHDMKATVQHLSPHTPILFKESWDQAEFNRVLSSLTGETHPDSQPEEQSGFAFKASVVSRPAPPQSHAAINRPRVLVVENREDWQNIVAGVLDEIGCFWRAVGSAQDALKEMERENFHLAIVDLKLHAAELPLRSHEGWLLLDYLVEARPKTKIIILSGRAGPGDVADLLTHYPILRFIEKQNFTPEAIAEAVAQATQAPELRIQSFGQFRLWRDGQTVEFVERPQAETLVKFLLTRRAREERAVSADEIITRLWPEADEVSGRKKLRPLINNARRTIEADIEARDSNFILRSANGYFFDVSGRVQWDLLAFWQRCRAGRQLLCEECWPEAIAELEAGRALYQGDFLAEDRYADWAIEMQRELANDFRDLLIALADAYAALEQYPQAIDACQTALRKDPLVESVYRRLMRFYYCLGEKGQALKVYRDCHKLFEELFGESPTPVTRQLSEAIANDELIDCE